MLVRGKLTTPCISTQGWRTDVRDGGALRSHVPVATVKRTARGYQGWLSTERASTQAGIEASPESASYERDACFGYNFTKEFLQSYTKTRSAVQALEKASSFHSLLISGDRHEVADTGLSGLDPRTLTMGSAVSLVASQSQPRLPKADGILALLPGTSYWRKGRCYSPARCQHLPAPCMPQVLMPMSLKFWSLPSPQHGHCLVPSP